MEQARWDAAARFYGRAHGLRPERIDLKVQEAHALKENGDMAAALAAYAQASAEDDDGLLHLALLHARLGNRSEAAQALSRLLERNPDNAAGFDALLALGLGAYLPIGLRERLRAYHRNAMTESIGRPDRAAVYEAALAEERVEAYDAIRPVMTFAPPSSDGAGLLLRVVVDARETHPAFLRMTFDGLLLSRHERWTACVVASNTLREHPVASLADLDGRVLFCDEGQDLPASHCDADVYLSAGTRLDPHALSWIAHVLHTTDVAACMCDWDHCVTHWNGPDHYFDPVLRGVFDPDWVLTTDFPPPLVGVRTGSSVPEPRDPDGRRAVLAALDESAVAHIALPLASVMRIPDRAVEAPAHRSADGEVVPVWSLEPRGFPPLPGTGERAGLTIDARRDRPYLTCGIPVAEPSIRVIIPTRDLPDMLERMVESLLGCAALPERVRITILDNRSREEASIACFARLRTRTGIEVLSYDAPFNWSQMNNVASQASSEPILVFANNDMEMVSAAWDHRIAGQLARTDVGIVGARLLYPDGQLQHAGMWMGLAEGSPVHAGVFAADEDAASDPLFDHVQAVAAVTGAFMAITRAHFDELGGFDAQAFAIAYNDVDLCLASRTAGRKILYDPGIELVHHESRTRGMNDNREKIAWDQGELRALYRKWREALNQNPALSPWWTQRAPYRDLRPLSPAFDPVLLTSSWRPRS